MADKEVRDSVEGFVVNVKGKATKRGEVGRIGSYAHAYSDAMGKGHLRFDRDEGTLIGDWSSPEPTAVVETKAVTETDKIIKSEKKLDDVAGMTAMELKAEIARLKIDVNMTAPNPGVLVMRLRNAIRSYLKKS